MSFPTTVQLNYGAEKVTTSGKKRTLGTRGVTPDGRVFYYARSGATALAACRVVQAKAQEADNVHALALTPSTVVGDWNSTAGSPGIQVGSVSIGVIWSSAHASAEYEDGYMVVETSPGYGTYRVASDTGAAVGAAGSIIRLHPDDAIAKEILTTVSKLGFYANPYSSVIVAPTTLTSIVLGVNPVAVPLNEYFWCQTMGPALIRYNDLVAATLGRAVLSGVGATAGDVIGVANTTVTTTLAVGTTLDAQHINSSFPILGYAMVGVPDDGDYMKVFLTFHG